MKEESVKPKLTKLNRLVETLCGIYSRVARRLGVDRSYVSRVARGERRSEPIENALVDEYKRVSRTKE
jgi:transcriptional regulator with XRE-family HTH domain